MKYRLLFICSEESVEREQHDQGPGLIVNVRNTVTRRGVMCVESVVQKSLTQDVTCEGRAVTKTKKPRDVPKCYDLGKFSS